MRIGIDARLIEETGVGRYIRNLIQEISRFDRMNQYVVFLRRRSFDAFVLPNSRWKKVCAEVRWHSLSEQMVMPGRFAQEKLDVLHVPYHNPPVFYQGHTVITIHDLTILHFNTGKATLLPQPIYQLKRLGYWLELWIGLRKAKRVIVVSEATKREIMDHFHISPEKIVVTYEGVDEKLSAENKKQTIEHRLIKSPYFLYVGNAYPHKNLETLLEAWKLFIAGNSVSGYKLVLAGNDDFFYRRLSQKARDLELVGTVKFFGAADDATLVNLYRHAAAFVFPSLMEGFGLPALEALSVGCRVLVSDIPVFHEILGSFVTYFDPRSPGSIAAALDGVLIPDSKKPEANELSTFLGSYSWLRMAKETRETYERSARL